MGNFLEISADAPGITPAKPKIRPDPMVIEEIKIIDRIFDGTYCKKIMRDRTMDLIKKSGRGSAIIIIARCI